MSKIIELPEEIEQIRDKKWRREEISKVEIVTQVEALVEDLGFCLALTDARTNLPSVYIAVCGRRDAHSPRNVQKDFEMSLAWTLKDEVMRRGKIYYSKLCKSRAMFVAPRLVPHFNAIWGVRKIQEKSALSEDANKVLKILRKEWEMGTSDLRAAAKIETRQKLTKALDELQRAMKVVPQECLYHPTFTYIWTLAEARFPKEMAKKVSREEAVKELARAFLQMSSLTVRGEFAKALGITRVEAGKANHALVKEGFAERLAVGVYKVRNEK
ncbi:MAG: hypothetical protein LH472_00010 [Pyrinomonadaceae bacterium]|nr:hypothetical protein [Pyrinomonadaceae bacterium]